MQTCQKVQNMYPKPVEDNLHCVGNTWANRRSIKQTGSRDFPPPVFSSHNFSWPHSKGKEHWAIKFLFFRNLAEMVLQSIGRQVPYLHTSLYNLHRGFPTPKGPLQKGVRLPGATYKRESDSPCQLQKGVTLPTVTYKSESDSPLSPTKGGQTPYCYLQKGVILPSATYKRGSDSPLSPTKGSQTPHCHLKKGIRLPSATYKRESDSPLSHMKGGHTPQCHLNQEVLTADSRSGDTAGVFVYTTKYLLFK